MAPLFPGGQCSEERTTKKHTSKLASKQAAVSRVAGDSSSRLPGFWLLDARRSPTPYSRRLLTFPEDASINHVTFGGGTWIPSTNLDLRSRKLPPVRDHIATMVEETPLQSGPSAVHVTCGAVFRQRDPPIFTGSGDSDVEEWLSKYERVSASNKWDDQMKLGYVQFYLADIAQLWYNNHESDIPTWSVFKTSITDVFGRPSARKLRAEQRLRQRAQQPGENFTGYIEDVLNLCNRVNSTMTEEDKIKHILKGIEDDAFQMLLARNPTTVAALVSLCQSFDELRRQRSIARQALTTTDTLSSLHVTARPADQQPLLSTIKEFIREEVARQLLLLPLTNEPVQTLAPDLQHVIRTQIAEHLPPSIPQQPLVTAPLTYAAVAARPPQQPMPYTRPAMPTPAMPTPAMPTPASPLTTTSSPLHYAGPSPSFFRRQDVWRTPDNRPICFACGVAGHVARHCRRCPPSFFDTVATPDPSSSRTPPRYAADNRPSFSNRRSPSPRRRSLSPMRRRSATEEGN